MAAANHLVGSSVTSNKPIAITVKDDELFNTACWDLGGDQIIPINNLTNEYIAVQGFLSVGVTDRVFVTAVGDNTRVSVNGNLFGVINMNQTLVVPFPDSAIYITANNNIYAFQLSGSGCEVGLSSLPAIYCRGSYDVSFARSSSAPLALLIITRNGNQSFFQLNGTSLNSTSFTVVPGTNSQYVYARMFVSTTVVAPLSSARLINTRGLFHLGIVHGDGPSGGARFGYFSDYSHPTADVLPDTIISCGSPVALALPTKYDNFAWNNGDTSATIMATQTGLYKVSFTNPDGCQFSDSSYVEFQIPERDSSNVSICGGSSFKLPWGTTVNMSGLYSDTVDNMRGCDSIISIVRMNVNPVVQKELDTSICSGKNYNLPWGVLVSNEGMYADTTRSINGCDSMIQVVRLTINSAPTVSFDTSICIGQSFRLPSNKEVSTAGIYQDTLKALYGCDSLISVVNLTVNPLPYVTISKSNDIDCGSGTSTLTATGGDKYIWSPGSSLNDSTIASPIARLSATTVYYVDITSAEGCSTDDSIAIDVSAGRSTKSFQMPNAFTPNGDGIDDCFGLKNWDTITSLSFSIYSRWGELVFFTNDPSMCWDGTFKGQKLPSGAFAYQVSATTGCGVINRKGTVLLLK